MKDKRFNRCIAQGSMQCLLKIQQKHEIKISSDLYEAVILDPILLGGKNAIKINVYGKN